MADDDQPLAPIVEKLGITHDMKPSQQVVQMFVLMKVIDFDNEDNTPTLYYCSSPGLDWMEKRALVYITAEVLQQAALKEPDE